MSNTDTTQSSSVLNHLRLGVIGCGNLGAAIIKGLLGGELHPRELRIFDKNPSKLQPFLRAGRVEVADAVSSLLREVDAFVLAVKPSALSSTMSQVKAALGSAVSPSSGSGEFPVLLSVVGGATMSTLRELAPVGMRIARAMPNLAVEVNSGLTGIVASDERDLLVAHSVFSALGRVVELGEERQIDAVLGASASGLAFACVVLDAMADGAVKMGLAREDALLVAAQTLRGAADLVASGEHPARIKDRVATPAGTTIEGLHVLERQGLRNALISAVESSTLRARQVLEKS